MVFMYCGIMYMKVINWYMHNKIIIIDDDNMSDGQTSLDQGHDESSTSDQSVATDGKLIKLILTLRALV